MLVKKRFSFLHVCVVLAVLMLSFSACNVPDNALTQAPVVVPTELVTTEAPTQEPVADAGQVSPTVSVDVSAVAQSFTSQVVPAVPSSSDFPWWEVMPQHTQLTLEGYPISGHLLQAQIIVYPVEDLDVNEVASGIPDDLKTLLQTQGAGDRLPYLPFYNAGQVMHAQVEYLDFKNGRGVRYLTQFDQAVLPINNHELHYTFQGLTDDGKYYVAAVLPVNLSVLPADESVDLNYPPTNFVEDFPAYLADTVDLLNGQPPSAFTPDLSTLDAMIESLEIK